MGHRRARVYDGRTRRSRREPRERGSESGRAVARAAAGRPREAGAARAAILAAADRLFYAHGVATVSLETVADAAGVTRRTLYYHFAGKEALVGEYLRARDAQSRAFVNGAGAASVSPARRVLAVFDALEAWFRKREFRGCAFVNAVGEGGETIVVAGTIARRHKRALRDFFVRVAREGAASDAEALGEQLMVLFDGAMSGAATRRDPAIALHAKAAARILLAAHGVRETRPAPSAGARKRPTPSA